MGATAFYWFYLKDNPHHFFSRNKITDTTSNINISNPSRAPLTGTNGVTDKVTGQKTEAATAESDTATTAKTDIGDTKYTVVNKAWFHYEPDSSKIKPLFLEPGRDVVLTPKDEENGFVYVVYINSRGQATHGWLDKKDLEAVE